MSMEFRKAEAKDQEQVWEILKATNEVGDSFAFAADTPKDLMIDYWFSADKHTYVVTENDIILGTFFLKDNQPGRGAHIANGAYAVAPAARRKGVGRKMGELSLAEARRLGYRAMQFNLVVKSNEHAVRLWKSLGFAVIGEIPDAFRHPTLGHVNAYIMYRKIQGHENRT